MRRVVLSRKGMDATYGGLASPMLPGEPLHSLPIPSVARDGFPPDAMRYAQLRAGSETLQARIHQLAGRRRGLPRLGQGQTRSEQVPNCHHDPDLMRDALPSRPSDWRAALGQVGAAQSHLASQGIGPGDLFLFFGWFRSAERTPHGLRYVPGSPDLHVLFGWLEVGEVVPLGPEDPVPDWLAAHPHASGRFRQRANNTVYAAREHCTWVRSLPGAGVFQAHPHLVLTAAGQSRSRWALPRHLRHCSLTYHRPTAWKADYFQSAAIGQEFVMVPDERATDWVRSLLQLEAARSA